MTRAGKTHSKRIVGACALPLAILFLLALAAPAWADTVIGSPGTGAGQYKNPQAVAVDQSNGHLYVADRDNNRVGVFDASGNFVEAFGWGVTDGSSAAFQHCTTACFAGIAGSGNGQFNAPSRIAVDNNPASPAYRSVYVLDSGSRIQRFTPLGEFVVAFNGGGGGGAPIAVGGAGGAVYVGDEGKVRKFAPTGALIEQISPLMRDECDEGKASKEVPLILSTTALAADAAGDFYVATNGPIGGVRKYDPSGKLLDPCKPRDFASFNIRGLALDTVGNLFVSDVTGIDHVNGYDPSGAPVAAIYGDTEHRAESLAVYPAGTGDVFAHDPFAARIIQVPLPQPGPIVLQFTTVFAPITGTFASPVSNTKATLHTAINPVGKSTTYHFEYVDQQSFEEDGFDSPATRKSPESASIGSDLTLHEDLSSLIGCTEPSEELIAEGKCLTPDTTYRFRAVAKNSAGEDEGPVGTFTTAPSVRIEATWATGVGLESARLHSEVNPLGIFAAGYFEYVDDASFKAGGFADATPTPDVPGGAPPIDLGGSEAAVSRSVQIGSLIPGATYHYRFVAFNAFATIPGPERAFIAFAKAKPNEECDNQALRTGAAVFLSDCRAYEMVSPVDKSSGDIVTLGTTVGERAELAKSAATGERFTYSSYRSFGDSESAPYSSQYLASRDPLTGWSTEAITPPQEGITSAGPLAALDTAFRAFSDDLCDAWVNYGTELSLDPAVPGGFMNLYRADNCGAGGYRALVEEEPPAGKLEIELQGLSGGGQCAVFRAKSPLLSSPEAASKADVFQVYENCGAGLRLISVLPDGTPSESNASAGVPDNSTDGRRATVTNAISADGSRVFWTESSLGSGKLYLRLNAGQPQSAVSAGECTEAQMACTLPVSTDVARFWLAAEDGSKAVYEEGGSLHLFEVDEGEGKDTVVAGKSRGVMGASEDATRIYFASEEALDGAAVADSPNLYLYRAGEVGEVHFVATLAKADVGSEILPTPTAISPAKHVARVTPDGNHAAFMSRASLTGYDNKDAVSGEAAAEVYLYDATAEGGAGRLICASCNPSGARPVGRDIKVEAVVLIGSYWAAGWIPASLNQLYGSRVLSEDGNRVFFESVDALTIRDTNGVKDVYQWEANGTGDCSEGSVEYSLASDGCIGLISSGESEKDSSFRDASSDGSDVFFVTAADLLARDHGLIDVYDARSGGGLPEPPPNPAPCEGEACQNPSPPPPVSTPASASFRGAGNVSTPSSRPRCPQGKRRVRRSGKARCVPRKAKKRRPSTNRRAKR